MIRSTINAKGFISNDIFPVLQFPRKPLVQAHGKTKERIRLQGIKDDSLVFSLQKFSYYHMSIKVLKYLGMKKRKEKKK